MKLPIPLLAVCFIFSVHGLYAERCTHSWFDGDLFEIEHLALSASISTGETKSTYANEAMEATLRWVRTCFSEPSKYAYSHSANKALSIYEIISAHFNHSKYNTLENSKRLIALHALIQDFVIALEKHRYLETHVSSNAFDASTWLVSLAVRTPQILELIEQILNNPQERSVSLKKLTQSEMLAVKSAFDDVDADDRTAFADAWVERILSGIKRELIELRDVKLNEAPGCYYNNEGEWVLYSGAGIVGNALAFLSLYFSEAFEVSSYYTPVNVALHEALLGSMRGYFSIAKGAECEELDGEGSGEDMRFALKEHLTIVIEQIDAILAELSTELT